MNCKHELAPWCAPCNGSPDPFAQTHVSLDYSEHKYDLLDPETARTVLGEVRIASRVVPSNNPAPSERDFDEAQTQTWIRAINNISNCDFCIEFVRELGDHEADAADAHLAGLHDEPRKPATEYPEPRIVGRPRWMVQAGILA